MLAAENNLANILFTIIIQTVIIIVVVLVITIILNLIIIRLEAKIIWIKAFKMIIAIKKLT